MAQGAHSESNTKPELLSPCHLTKWPAKLIEWITRYKIFPDINVRASQQLTQRLFEYRKTTQLQLLIIRTTDHREPEIWESDLALI